MTGKPIRRRQFLMTTGAAASAAVVGFPGSAFAGAPGAKVETPSLITATAKFDPVRPEAVRLIAQAAQKIGFDINPNPIDYNQGIQKVVMQHDYDMFLVLLAGVAVRVDPEVFIHGVHHSSNYKKGGFNWTGYKNLKVDELAAAQQSEMNSEKRRELVFKAQELINEDQANNVIVYPNMTNAYRSDRISNLVPQMGEGIGSFWTDISMVPSSGDGYVRTGATVALKNLNPVAAIDGNEFNELRMVYDQLFRIDPDGRPKLWAAKTFALVDPTTIDITIRDGMTWHDGKPLTAEDVKFTFEYHAKWKAPFFRATLAKIKSIDITGKNALRFTLTEPFAPLLSNLFGAIFLIPKHIWQDIPEKAGVSDALNFANEKPIGSGPFKFDYWDRGKELKVSSFKNHFNPPKCAGIIRVVYGSHDAMAAAIEKGECDRTRYILKPSLMEDLNKVKNVVGKSYPSHGWYCLSYNLTKPPFDNPVIRKAMQYVIPRELIRDAVLGGYAESGGSVMAPANKFWHNPAVKAPSQDLDKARKILADAGFNWKGGKLHYPG